MEFFKDKKIFITGHTGFKGAWLSKILINFGAKVMGYSTECSTNPSMFRLLNLDEKMESIIGDIRDFDMLQKCLNEFKPDIVIHLSAIATIQEATAKIIEAYDISVNGTVKLLEAVKACGSVKSFVHVSTDTVYLRRENKFIYLETDMIGGSNAYSTSKACAELTVLNYKNNEYPRISITRSVNVIGGGDFNNSRIVPECVDAWINNRNIEIKNPNNIRPFLHVLETLYGYLLIAKKQYEDRSFEGIYNFSPDDEGYVSIESLAKLFCNNINNSIKFITKNSDPKVMPIIKTDSSKARYILKWKSSFTSNERINSIIEWNKSLINNEDMNIITDSQIDNFFRKIDYKI
jgi:CDP-glucose 4,6-dehydratase